MIVFPLHVFQSKYIHSYWSRELLSYLGASKFLQHFVNVRYSSVASDSFTEVVKVTNDSLISFGHVIHAPQIIMYNHHHHNLFVLSARIFLTLSGHPSLSSIAFGRSSGLHPVLAQSCCM